MRFLHLITALILFSSLTLNAKTWTGRNGKTVEGDFIKMENNKVHIKSPKGKIWKISVNNMIPADVDFAEKKERERTQKGISSLAEATNITKEDLLITAVFHLIVIFILFKLIFGDMSSFMQASHYGLKPDFISWWQGDGWADFWNEAKLKVFFFLVIALYIAELVVYKTYIKDVA